MIFIENPYELDSVGFMVSANSVEQFIYSGTIWAPVISADSSAGRRRLYNTVTEEGSESTKSQNVANDDPVVQNITSAAEVEARFLSTSLEMQADRLLNCVSDDRSGHPTQRNLNTTASEFHQNWGTVGNRIAAVFGAAAKELHEAEEEDFLPAAIMAGKKIGDGISDANSEAGTTAPPSLCATAVCSPAPSSVYPTDASTIAGTMGLSEVASEISDDDSTMDTDSVLSCLEDAQMSSMPEDPAKIQEHWYLVGHRLALVFAALNEEGAFEDEASREPGQE